MFQEHDVALLLPSSTVVIGVAVRIASHRSLSVSLMRELKGTVNGRIARVLLSQFNERVDIAFMHDGDWPASDPSLLTHHL